VDKNGLIKIGDFGLAKAPISKFFTSQKLTKINSQMSSFSFEGVEQPQSTKTSSLE
jgi:hypothetical protein